MKKTLLFIAATFILMSHAFAQTVILSENFNTYDGTTQSIPANWSFTDIGNNSFYNTASRSGPSGPNAYRLRLDSSTVTTPQFNGGDSLIFYTRGNGTDLTSSIEIQYTTDLSTWNTLAVLEPIDHVGGMRNLALTAGTKKLKFIYHKSAGDVSFDDFSIKGSPTGIDNISGTSTPFTVYPNPSSGPVQINLNEEFKNVKFSVFNTIGAEVKDVQIEKISNQKFKLNFDNKQPGFYFIRVQTEKSTFTTRITITAALTEKRTEHTA